MTIKNGYVRWVPLITLLIAMVVGLLGASAYLVGQHDDKETHHEAVHKARFDEFAKRIDANLIEIKISLKEIHKELHK